jgi:hypothetical protein
MKKLLLLLWLASPLAAQIGPDTPAQGTRIPPEFMSTFVDAIREQRDMLSQTVLDTQASMQVLRAINQDLQEKLALAEAKIEELQRVTPQSPVLKRELPPSTTPKL